MPVLRIGMQQAAGTLRVSVGQQGAPDDEGMRVMLEAVEQGGQFTDAADLGRGDREPLLIAVAGFVILPVRLRLYRLVA